MQYTINQLQQLVFKKVYDIYDIFKGFFGEEHVDLHDYNSLIKTFIRSRIAEKGYNRVDEVNALTDTEETYDVPDEFIDELNEQFAEKKVTIFVWWPTVTITNEHNRSINIQDLYAKITVQLDGRIPYECTGFLLNRTTYTADQFFSDYMHSHIRGIPKNNLPEFLSPCLGTGPIRETIGTLKNEYNEVTWMLFCQELSMYVTVESLTGIPYRRLEEVGEGTRYLLATDFSLDSADSTQFTNVFSKENLQEFIKYYLTKGHLSISYKGGKFCCGMSYFDYIIDVSNAFIDFYNDYLLLDNTTLKACYNFNLLQKVFVVDRKFYTHNNRGASNNEDLDHYRGKHILTFKGKSITLSIEEPQEEREKVFTTILSQRAAMYVLKSILTVINFRYNNEYYSKFRSSKDSTSVGKGVIYI
jgi:hypothetical protein